MATETSESLEQQRIRFQNILDRIRYRNDWKKVLKLDGNRFYFCFEWNDTCNFTGKPLLSRTSKYYLSPYMTDTEVVNRVFLAAMKGEEHETRERFQYRPSDETEWRAPYNTHIDINCLYDIADQYDVRN